MHNDTGRKIFYYHRHGLLADWMCADWLRHWLSDNELWDLLESLSPGRLRRFGKIVEANVYGPAYTNARL